MYSHVTLGCSDLWRAAPFFDALLTPLGLVRREVTLDGGVPSACWSHPGMELPRFYVYEPFDRRPASAGNGTMVAFLAIDRSSVDAAHAAGCGAGGRDEGAPGLRLHYGADYYGAYLRDPDGNKVHLVCRDGVQTSVSPETLLLL